MDRAQRIEAAARGLAHSLWVDHNESVLYDGIMALASAVIPTPKPSAVDEALALLERAVPWLDDVCERGGGFEDKDVIGVRDDIVAFLAAEAEAGDGEGEQ